MSDKLIELLNEGLPFLGKFKKVSETQYFHALQGLVNKALGMYGNVLNFDISNALAEVGDELPHIAEYGLDFVDSLDVDFSMIQQTTRLTTLVAKLWDDSLEHYDGLGFVSKKNYKVLDSSAQWLDNYLEGLVETTASIENNLDMYAKSIEHRGILTHFVSDEGIPFGVETEMIGVMMDEYLEKLPDKERQLVYDQINELSGNNNNRSMFA